MNRDRGPWYREPWPWILMSGPAIVVVAGIYTLVLAITTSDGLVTEDYYKRGLQINRTLAREVPPGGAQSPALRPVERADATRPKP